MNNRIIGTLILLTAVTAVQGCSREYDQKSLVPGVYEARSTPDKDGGYSIAKITVKNRRIAAVDYHTYTADGKLKDADYGKVNGVIVSQEDYKKALEEKGYHDEASRTSLRDFSYFLGVPFETEGGIDHLILRRRNEIATGRK